MQDMETSICESTTLVDEQNTLQLVDIRDNKLYWVTKLQDGHCWMTQNLDLDLNTTTILTPADSDVTANWTPVRATINAAAMGISKGVSRHTFRLPKTADNNSAAAHQAKGCTPSQKTAYPRTPPNVARIAPIPVQAQISPIVSGKR